MATVPVELTNRELGGSMHRSLARDLDLAMLAGLLAVGVVLPVIMEAVAGSLNVPRNDDWVYRRIADDLAQTGVLAFHNISAMVIGHILILQPFIWVLGPGTAAFMVAGIVFAIAGVLCTYALARQFLGPIRATVAVAVLLLFAPYLSYATSVMTDVPGFAAQFACLVLGVVALRRTPISFPLLVASTLVGLLAFTIRDFGIAAPACVLFAAICAEPRRRHWGLAGAIVVACGFLYLLKATLPGQALGRPVFDGSVLPATYAVSTVALGLLVPAVVAARLWRGRWKPRDLVIGAEVGLIIVGLRILEWLQTAGRPRILLENHASPWGAPTPVQFPGGRPLLFDDIVWTAVGVLALVATVAVLAISAGIVGAYLRRGGGSLRSLLTRLGTPIGILVLFALAVAGGMTIYGVGYALFDRYYWPLLPVASILFLYRPREVSVQNHAATNPARMLRAVPLAAAFAVTSSVALAFMLNSFAFDAARWNAGDRLVQVGIAPEEVDAGYEWVGLYQPGWQVGYQLVPTRTYYERLWPGRRQCGIATSTEGDAPPGSALIGTIPYSLFLVAGPEEQVYLYRVPQSICAKPIVG